MCDDEISWVFRFNQLLSPARLHHLRFVHLFSYFRLVSMYCNTTHLKFCVKMLLLLRSRLSYRYLHIVNACSVRSIRSIDRSHLYKWKSGQYWCRTKCSRRNIYQFLFHNVSLNKSTDMAICTQLNAAKTWIKNVLAIKIDCVNILINFMHSAHVREYPIVMPSQFEFDIWKI